MINDTEPGIVSRSRHLMDSSIRSFEGMFASSRLSLKGGKDKKKVAQETWYEFLGSYKLSRRCKVVIDVVQMQQYLCISFAQLEGSVVLSLDISCIFGWMLHINYRITLKPENKEEQNDSNDDFLALSNWIRTLVLAGTSLKLNSNVLAGTFFKLNSNPRLGGKLPKPKPPAAIGFPLPTSFRHSIAL